MLSSKALRYTLGGLLIVVVALAGWCCWVAYQVNKDLNDAVDHAETIRTIIENGDTDAIDAELAELQDASASAAERTSGPTWNVLTALPLIGDDAEGIEVTSAVIDDLANDGVEPLAQVADRLEALLPKDGAIPLDVVAELQAPIDEAQAAFASADATLDEQDASGYVGRLRERFTEFRDQVGTADRAMTAAQTTTTLLPTMLGAEGPRNYLLAFQNNAEVRATGGLPGALAEIEATDGTLSVGRQVAGSSLGQASRPILPLTDAEEQLYGDFLGTYFLDANFTPDVPRASDLMRAWWQKKYPADDLDGVLLIDTVGLSYILEATGPITVDGITLTADNAVDELLHNTYLRLEEPAAQDAFFARVAAAAFDQFSSGAADAAGLLRALTRSVDESRIFLHSFDSDEQDRLTGSAVAGEFLTDPDVEHPQINVTMNDSTGAKMSYFLRYDVDVNATYCSDGAQGFTAKARLRSTAPRDAATTLPRYVTGGGGFGVQPGTQVVTVRVFGPAGGSMGDFELNSRELDVTEVDQGGRPAALMYVELAPGQTVDLNWAMRGGADQTGAADLSVTPTIESHDYDTRVPSAC